MKHTSFLFLCLFILFSCSDKASKTIIEEKEKPSYVVLVFKYPQSYLKIEFGSGRTASTLAARNGYEIETIDSTGLITRHQINFEMEIDTISIPSNRELLEVKLTYLGIDQLTYFFEKGDTVVFEYPNGTPYAQIINRDEPANLTNIQIYLRDSISTGQFPAILEATNPGLPMESLFSQENARSIDMRSYIDEYRNTKGIEASEQLRILMADAKAWSLTEHQNQVLRSTIADYYWMLQQWVSETERLQSNGKSLDSEALSEVERLLNEIDNQYPDIKNNKNNFSQSISYQKALKYRLAQEFKPQMLELKTSGAGARIMNYTAYYDSIQHSRWIKEAEKRVMQYEVVDQILSNGSFFDIEERLKYLTKFKNDFQDTVLFNTLVKKYNVKFEIDDVIKLMDVEGNETTLEKFISENTDKLIYVDFWASWCAPCLKEMPSSQTLQADFKDENITFLYLSTDRKDDPWKKAIDKHQLKAGQHFRILNGDNSTAMNELKVQFIPRYMIYNNKGQLVNKDAPRPSDKEKLIAELNRYLANQ